MTKVNDADYGKKLLTGEPFTPEPIELTEKNAGEAFGFSLFDRQGNEYHFYLSKAGGKFEQYATAVAWLDLGPIGRIPANVLHISDPAKYGPQPSTEAEALSWMKAFTTAWVARGDAIKAAEDASSPIVMEPYEG